MGSAELYNHYRCFYETIIVGVLAYKLEVILENLLKQPELLLNTLKNHNDGSVFK